MTVTMVVVMPFDTIAVVVTMVVDTVVLESVYLPLEVGVIGVVVGGGGGGSSVDVGLGAVVVGS